MTINFKNVGYELAKNVDVKNTLARSILNEYHDFDENVSDVAKDGLYEGFQLRFAENNPDIKKGYVFKDNGYIAVDNTTFESFKGDKIALSVGLAMSYTSQAFGAMRTKNPNVHALIKPIRDKVNTYCSNRMKDLIKAVKDIKNEGKPKNRGATNSYDVTITEWLDGLPKKCKNALARGDDTANEKRTLSAIGAFKDAYFGANRKAKVQQ